MLLKKFTHSCVRLEKDGKVLTLDPGVYSETAHALAGADAVLITHEHPDHIDQGAVVKALEESPLLELYAPAGVAAAVREAAPDIAGRVFTTAAGESFEVAGFAVQGFSGQHALIHPSIPVVANVGYLIDGSVYHPGDSLIVPDGVNVDTLLVPVHAPWSKVGDVIDFVVSVRAPRAFQIHDGLLNENGLALTEGNVARLGAKYGTTFRHLESGESVEL